MPVLQAFSVYFSSSGIQSPFPSSDPGIGLRPIGALALAATAVGRITLPRPPSSHTFQVEQGYLMHNTGDYIANRSSFSSKWDKTTKFYLNKIQNDLTADDWTSIFQALHCLQESCTRED